jgi:hypothetical protein
MEKENKLTEEEHKLILELDWFDIVGIDHLFMTDESKLKYFNENLKKLIIKT